MINSLKSVKRNFLYSILYQFLTMITPLFVTPYVSRVLHAEGIGVYGYTYATASYFVLFIMLGLNNYGNRTIARYREDKKKLSKFFWSIYGMQILTSIIFVCIYILFIIVSDNNIISWIMLLYVLSASFDINWFFQGLEEFKIIVTRNAIIKILSSLSIFIFVKDMNDLVIYSLIMTGSILISQLLLWPFLRKKIYIVKIDISDITVHFKPNIILFLPAIAVSFYRIMDKVMLGVISGTLEVGYYESTDKLISIPLCIVTALGTVMMPRMANIIYKKSKEEIEGIVTKSLILSVIISAPMMSGMMGIISILVPIFYGQGYEKCIYLFYILLPSTLFVSMANVIRTQILIPYALDKIFVKSCIFGAICNIGINFILIPRYNSIGAAIGTLCTEALVFGIQIMYTRKIINLRDALKPIIFNIMAAIIMGSIVYLIPDLEELKIINLILKVILGVFIYLLEIYIYVYFSKNKIIIEIVQIIFTKKYKLGR